GGAALPFAAAVAGLIVVLIVVLIFDAGTVDAFPRSEERRVGKERRAGGFGALSGGRLALAAGAALPLDGLGVVDRPGSADAAAGVGLPLAGGGGGAGLPLVGGGVGVEVVGGAWLVLGGEGCGLPLIGGAGLPFAAAVAGLIVVLIVVLIFDAGTVDAFP